LSGRESLQKVQVTKAYMKRGKRRSEGLIPVRYTLDLTKRVGEREIRAFHFKIRRVKNLVVVVNLAKYFCVVFGFNWSIL